jgi:hypothetical protein
VGTRRDLREAGLANLITAMERNRKAFGKIKITPSQSNLRRTQEEKVKEAERLAANNGGFVPYREELIDSGNEDIYRDMIARPESYSHLPKLSKFKSVNEHRITAINLAAANNGRLPPREKLQELKQHGLLVVMTQYHEMFADIPRDSNRPSFDKTFDRIIEDLSVTFNYGVMTSAQKSMIATFRRRYKLNNLTKEQIKTVERLFLDWKWSR